jgi:xylose dehydrogenase (NAD/NADP)
MFKRKDRKTMSDDQVVHDNPVRWGIIGAASIGAKVVGPAINASSNGCLAAVGSRDKRRAAELFAFAPDACIYGDYESVLQDPEIEAVYIPLPNSLHAEWTIKALQAGKHVLCEKPLAITVKEGARMLDAARIHDRLLMEACMYRFHPQIIYALDQVNAGVIGPVRLVRVSCAVDLRLRPDNIRWKPELGGGSLIDSGCLAVNFCRAVYGRQPHVVAARVYAPTPGGVDVATSAVLDFEGGRFGMIDTSFETPVRQGAEIVGEKGMITIPVPFTPWDIEPVVFVTRHGEMTEQGFPRLDQYQVQVEHFARCVRSGGLPAMSLNETLENIATIEAIYRAASHNWPPVRPQRSALMASFAS